MERQHWPAQLWLVRHGQSQGNVARDEAHEGGKLVIDLEWRDVDVPLSDLGEQQAAAAGRWFAERPEAERPQILLSSSASKSHSNHAQITRTFAKMHMNHSTAYSGGSTNCADRCAAKRGKYRCNKQLSILVATIVSVRPGS